MRLTAGLSSSILLCEHDREYALGNCRVCKISKPHDISCRSSPSSKTPSRLQPEAAEVVLVVRVIVFAKVSEEAYLLERLCLQLFVQSCDASGQHYLAADEAFAKVVVEVAYLWLGITVMGCMRTSCCGTSAPNCAAQKNPAPLRGARISLAIKELAANAGLLSNVS